MRAQALLRLIVAAAAIAACASAGGRSGPALRTGPQAGSVVVVGGGAMGQEIFKRFILLAGGPDAPIVVIPTAQGSASYDQDAASAAGFRRNGAKDVVVIHTDSKAIANTDSFVAHIKRARGVWFGGGRHFRLVDAYAGTKSEAAFHDVLARGGVVGGSSAGASILASYLIRGAPSNDNQIMSHPGYLTGFGFLKNIAIDQHVVARSRLPDLADSVTSKRTDLLGISEDEGTAWVIRGDTGEIIGRSKGFVYNGREKDDGKPFLTLWPGDRYDLGARRVISRAIDETGLTHAFVDSLFRDVTAPATILVAMEGKVLLNKSWNVPPQDRYQPTTTARNFDLGNISDSLAANRGMIQRAGMAHTRFDSTTKTYRSNVDNLYRWATLLEEAAPGGVTAIGGRPDGKRSIFLRDSRRNTAIIILTENETFDARQAAAEIAARLR